MVRRLPPLNALRAFEAAARHGSFIGAAEELYVTPAAVSHQVKTLESFLGVDLFRRYPRGLKLTEAGQSYAPGLTDGLNRLARAESNLHGSSPKGTLSITILPSFGNLWLSPRLGGFKNLYPEIELRIISDARTTDFATEDVDVAIRYGFGDYPGLWTRLLFTEEVFPVCAPALLNQAPLRDLKDLENHTLLHDFDLLKEEPSLSWKPWLRKAGLSAGLVDAGIAFNDSTTLYRAAINGAGVAIGRSVLLSELLENGRLVRPLPDSRTSESAYYLVTTESAAETPKVRAFLDWMLAQSTGAEQPDG